MKLSKADMLAWEIVSDVLPVLSEDEVELLPYLAASYHQRASMIGAQPGAFNAAEVSSIAISAYCVIIEGLKLYSPKLADAAIDVAKDYFKSKFHSIGNASNSTNRGSYQSASSDLEELRRFVVKTGVRYNLDRSASEAVANAVVAHIAIKGLKG